MRRRVSLLLACIAILLVFVVVGEVEAARRRGAGRGYSTPQQASTLRQPNVGQSYGSPPPSADGYNVVPSTYFQADAPPPPSSYDAPPPPSTDWYPPPPQPPKAVVVPTVVSLEECVAIILRRSGLGQPGSFPRGTVSLDEKPVYDFAFAWAQVQRPLEDLFQQFLGLEYRPQLILVHRGTGKDESQGTLVFTHPQDERIVAILAGSLGIEQSRFDEKLKIYGERMTFEREEFKLAFQQGDSLNLARTQAAIQELLQDDFNLAQKAADLGGAFKPISVPGGISSKHARVVTEWQRLAGDGSINIYWRANVLVQQHPMKHWEVETVIEFGQLYRSQSFDQIRPFTNSDRLGSFDNVNAGTVIVNGDLTNLTTVRYKAVLSPSERLLTQKHREAFGELASDLWNGVKDSLTNRK